MATKIRSPQDLYSQLLIQSDGQSAQWKGCFAANDMVTPTNIGRAFDRSSMGISAAVDRLGVVLESTLLAEREISVGKLVAPLQGTSRSVRYVGHHLVHPRRPRQQDAVNQFKTWLFVELENYQRKAESPNGD